ncbi:hypothetical protein BUALT_Bualt18G0013200 [Buddleja alternifolia]|uniref:Dirigent protein n=1 Tax=Buddleja alternifolia TaxID=168488 RepID=A0AAV6W9P0_9LAMI|nr:hypothetical protein BUALT_Bualt18G0013200 [Buddleja alternifolia]
MAIIRLSLLLFLVMFTYSGAELGSPTETHMTLYFHDYSGGVNATVMEVTGPPGKLPDFTKFGAMFVTDDPITKEIHATSSQVARGQGLYITSALDGSNTHVLMSIVFTNEEYGGSTLEIQATNVQLERVSEVAIVGGSRKFRFARGYATFETMSFDSALHYAVIQFNVTVLHYQSSTDMFFTDDPITKEIHATSSQVARGQGLYVTSALDGSNIHVLMSIVFTNEE